MAKVPGTRVDQTAAERVSYASYSAKSRTDLQKTAVTRGITNATSHGKEDLIAALMLADG